ncbi:MAG: hypothetical protein CMH15_11275 [Mesonia sp.]|nr:hypothetical protein [Mesonia sp.]MAQ41607.1 hypothetical protein [Mesonia sp.]|tara:strand:- start:1246 stop:1761 length:516 start_codon:yes stop_codon:yes gene_type:complete
MISCTNDSNDIVSSGSNAEINQSQASVESTIALGGGGWGGSIKLRIGRTSKNCGGLGICRVDKIKVNTPIGDPTWVNVPPDPAAPNQTSTLETNFIIEHIEGIDNLVLEVSPEILDDFIEKEGGDFFVMEEDYIFEDEIAEKMGLKRGFTLERGRYPLERFEDVNSYYVRL